MRTSYRRIHFSPTTSVVAFPPKTMEELLAYAAESTDGDVVCQMDEETIIMKPNEFSFYLEKRREVDHYDLHNSLFSIIKSPCHRASCILWLTSPTRDNDEVIQIDVVEGSVTPTKKHSALDLLSPAMIPQTPDHSPPPELDETLKNVSFADDTPFPEEEASISASSLTDAPNVAENIQSTADLNGDAMAISMATYVTNEIRRFEWDGTWKVEWKSGRNNQPSAFRITVRFYGANTLSECFLVIAKKKGSDAYQSQLRARSAISRKAGLQSWKHDDGTMIWLHSRIESPSSNFDVKKIPSLTATDGMNFRVVGEALVNRMETLYDAANP